MARSIMVFAIGIAGGSGSGKSTLAHELARRLPAGQVALLSQDSYYKSLRGAAERHNFDHPRALDLALLGRHVQALRAGRSVRIPTYDFKTHRRTRWRVVLKPTRFLVVEGTLIFAVKPLRDAFDLRVFVDSADDLRLLRRFVRDLKARGRTPASVARQYLGTVRPMHARFVEPSARHAHLRVLNDGAIEQLARAAQRLRWRILSAPP
jgi:uridine kinase